MIYSLLFVVFVCQLASGLSSNEYPKTFEEAAHIIHDYVESMTDKTVTSSSLCELNNCCSMSADESCPISKLSKDSSMLVLPGGNTRCVNSDSTPFAFQVIPGDSDKLLFYFMGGGACWDEASTKAGLCFTDVIPVTDLVGIWDRTDQRNAFRTYTVVNVLYCSGDLHGGNTTRPYNDKNGKPVVQVGLYNTRATLDWVKDQMSNGGLAPKLSEIVVMGCSAGSLGSQFWAQEIFKQLPYERAAVVLDSYAGVFPKGSLGPIFHDFGFCGTGFLTPALDKKCMNKELEIMDIGLVYPSETPNVPYAFIQSKVDQLQVAFYEAVALSTGKLPITPSNFYHDLNELFGLYNKVNPNFLTYLVDGDQHCFTPWGLYFNATTKGPQDAGTTTKTEPVYQWTNKFPLNEEDIAETRCDNGHYIDNTYCSSKVIPKSFTEHW